MITFRRDQTLDIPAIFQVNYPYQFEAEILNKLRIRSAVILSIVTKLESAVVGHILIIPVRIKSLKGECKTAGLGRPEYYPCFVF